MRQFVIHAVNISLVALCSFQGAKMANLVAAESLQPSQSYEVGVAEAPAPTASAWETRKTIVDRNLFGAKIVDDSQPEPEPVVEESVEETKLPLVLEATVASPNPRFSWAAILDERSRETEILRVGEVLEGHARVSVASIERRRILLKNSGRHEELLLNEDLPPTPAATKTTSAADARKRSRAARKARRPSRSAEAERVKEMRQRQIDTGQEELTLEQITQEVERLRQLEAD